MSMVRRRTPAMFAILDPGPPGANTQKPTYFGQVNRVIRETDEVTTLTWRDVHRLDAVRVNPIMETPRLIQNSLAQPITRWGVQFFRRVHMRTTPRFLGRWVYVGYLINKYADRGRMAGIETRTAGGGYTYVYPQFKTSPRAVDLAGGQQQ